MDDPVGGNESGPIGCAQIGGSATKYTANLNPL